MSGRRVKALAHGPQGHGLAPSSQQHVNAPLIDMLELLVDGGTLDVVSLVRLGSCSRLCRRTAAALLANSAALLLPAAVQQAAHAERAGSTAKDGHIKKS
jgi:hypothetical protein